MIQRTKYRSSKIEIDGITFDSKKEAKRYQELKDMAFRGDITDLQIQVKYVLIPQQREPDSITPNGRKVKGKILERECSYYADFVYKKNGETIVEDVKGMKIGAAYSLFSIKRKLMLWRYGIRVREV